uniref:Ig-like domain-containing protein n=1 Tax=Eptatretus burgeri TaxID=7764 RepID=A0A8C4WZP1_EPTBU
MCFCGSTVRPKILKINLDLDPLRLVCKAEAKPSPIIKWLNPLGVHVVGSKITVGTITHQANIQTVSFLNLTEDDPEGNYTCLVKNKYGNVTGNVTFNIPSIHPKILRMQSDLNSSWGLVCQAKAKPSPNIMWFNPQGHLINEGEATVVAMDQNKIRYVSFLNRTEDDPEGNYTCLVKNKDGTTTGNVIFDIPFLRPKILRIQSDLNSSTSWGLVCQAKAKPSPNITWLNPQGHLINEGEATVVAMNQNKIRYVSFLNRTEDDPEGNYTCLVKNKDGTTTGNVIFDIPFCKAPEEVLWFFIVSSVSLFLILLVLFFLTLPFTLWISVLFNFISFEELMSKLEHFFCEYKICNIYLDRCRC